MPLCHRQWAHRGKNINNSDLDGTVCHLLCFAEIEQGRLCEVAYTNPLNPPPLICVTAPINLGHFSFLVLISEQYGSGMISDISICCTARYSLRIFH